VHKETHTALNSKRMVTVEISHLPKGNYLVQLVAGSAKDVFKLIKP